MVPGVRVERAPFPLIPAGAKATSGALTVAVIGHSIAAGYAATGASTTIPANVTCRDDGVLLGAWPSVVQSPNRGCMHTLAVDLLAQGYSAVNLFRRATPGIALSTMMSTNWPALVTDLASQSVTPDVIVMFIGENDMQAGEGSVFAGRFDADLDKMQRTYPHTRILVALPVTTDLGGYPELATVTDAIEAACATRITRGTVSNVGVSLADTVHPDAAGADTQGSAAASAWETVG